MILIGEGEGFPLALCPPSSTSVVLTMLAANQLREFHDYKQERHGPNLAIRDPNP